jgi:Xaa-Pro aminopeptidase
MIKMSEYAKRRKQLMQTVGPTGMVILPGAQEVIRNGDAVYPFRQNSDFYYMTGFNEPNAVAILIPQRQEGEYILFNQIRDHQREIWEGPCAGQEGACKDFLADQAFAFSELENILPKLLLDRETIYYALGMNTLFDKILLRAVNKVRAKARGGAQAPLVFTDVNAFIHEMRLFKSATEIAMIQKAIDASMRGHVQAMKICQPGMNESELEAELVYQFNREGGARHQAYSAIVGSGQNTCVLHYVKNNMIIKDGDLVLIDAGAEYENYAADITRTFPANGHFSSEQRAIYELVLASQLAAIESIKPGASWLAAQNSIINVLIQGLVDLGLLRGSMDELIEKKAYLPFYMHRSGHWLGLDVHDVGTYKQHGKWRCLQPGMVLTVEPGIYITNTIPGVDECWHRIGVRIEDDVLVTDKGQQVLSQRIPKKITDIEALMAR